MQARLGRVIPRVNLNFACCIFFFVGGGGGGGGGAGGYWPFAGFFFFKTMFLGSIKLCVL